MRNFSSVLHRNLNMTPSHAIAGNGEYIVRHASRPVIDLSSGAGIMCLGYNNIRVTEAIKRQVDFLPYAHAMNWSAEPVEELAQRLLQISSNTYANSRFLNGGVMFLNTGAEAVEAACKLGVQYWRETSNFKSKGFVTFFGREHSFHGNTFFTLALGDHPRKSMYSTETNGFNVMRFRAFRPSLGSGPSTVEGLRTQALGDLEEKLMGNLNSEAVVVIETVGGTTLGIEPPDAEYLAGVRHLCDKYNALLIYDEVLSGNYRTGQLFAWQHYAKQIKRPAQIEPDMITLGKGLTGGYLPLSAVIVSDKIMNMISDGSGRLWHSTTNQNHVLGCAAANAALSAYQNILTHVHLLGGFMTHIAKMLRDEKLVHSVEGVGTLWGIRLDPSRKDLHLLVRERLLARDIAVYTDGGTMFGKGNMILLAPPYCMVGDVLNYAATVIVDVLRGV